MKAAKSAKGRNARLASPGLKADKTAKIANASVTLVTVFTVGAGLAPSVGCARGDGPARWLDGAGRGPSEWLAAFREAAPVLEGGQGGQRIRDSCDRVDSSDTCRA